MFSCEVTGRGLPDRGVEGRRCSFTLSKGSAGESLCSSAWVIRWPASLLPSEVVDGTSPEVLDALDAGLRGESRGLLSPDPSNGRRSDSMQLQPVHSCIYVDREVSGVTRSSDTV